MNADDSTPNQDSPFPSADSAADPAAADAAFAESAAPGPSAQETVSMELEKLRQEVREANDRALRSHAELENFRKRSRREMEEERRYAALPLIRDVLNVLDNLQRAIEAAEKANTAGSLLEGVKMVASQLNTYLEQHHCRVIPTVGTPFDPNFHEAIAQESSAEHPAGVVSRVARMGHQLHDRVVRPAQVLVSTGPMP